jgi:multidrug efflux pump subunit AcrB
MHKVIAWFVHNSIAANLLMAILIVAGLLALPTIHQEEFPNLELDAVSVAVPYLGAAPEEVEEAVCIRIEEAVEGTEGINKIRSSASEGVCSVVIELVEGVYKTKVTNDIKSQVDAIDSFPGETEKPVTTEMSIRARVMDIAISGHADERSLKLLGQKIRDDIVALPAVSQAQLLYARPYEISIEVSEQTLRQYGLTLQEIGEAIASGSLDVPGGTLKTEGGEILLRTKGQSYVGRDFEKIVVLSKTDGTSVTLGDIATVVDGFEDSGVKARMDGEPSVGILISRVGKEDTIEIADQVKAYLEQARQRVPEGIELTLWVDESQDLVDRLAALGKNARSGLLLVMIVLTLFLRFRLALWVAAGIPVALLGTVAMFPLLDISISTMSVMAFILVLGILVDDAIVVGERVYAHEQMGKPRLQAAIDGTQEVSVPVIFGVLTTMATFIPLIFIPGEMSGFFAPMGIVVIIALAFSILESQLILPSHLAHRRTEREQGNKGGVNTWLRFQEKVSGSMQTVAEQYYQPLVSRALGWRYLIAAAGLAALLILVSLFASGRIVLQFFPAIEGVRLYAALSMPEGTPIDVTATAAARIEEAAELLRTELDSDRGADEPSMVKHVFTSIGTQLLKGGPSGSPDTGDHLAEVGVELDIPAYFTGQSTGRFASRWRELTGNIPDAVELSFTSQYLSAGKAIDIELEGSDFEELRSAAAELRHAAATYPGVMDISDTFRAGKQEVQLTLLPQARALGLTTEDLGQQVRQAFYGYEAQRIQRGKDDVRVMVRFPENERRSLGDLEQMRIRTSDGFEVPFSSVARVELARGYTTIKRVNGRRVVNVFADVDRGVSSPEMIIADLKAKAIPDILQRHPNVSYRLSGEAEEASESMGGLASLAALALLIIYALLAIPLRSYLQPLVIMSVIPFGALGAIIGHWIMGMDLVFFSLLGIVALSGVVVNSSLVLVDHINRQRGQEKSLEWVVSHAGSVRFRPIVLTSLTTFIGLAPMMLDNSLSTGMFIPMAISLGFGVIFGTVITLFMVPCLYMIMEDLTASRAAPDAQVTGDTAGRSA